MPTTVLTTALLVLACATAGRAVVHLVLCALAVLRALLDVLGRR
ncbi:hypothetical protein ACFWZ2_30125 [Streptomyces sp. NPDC059002]